MVSACMAVFRVYRDMKIWCVLVIIYDIVS